MDKLRICFCDFWPEIKDENIFLSILQKHFDVEETTANPDVVFHSIFGGMKEASKYNCKKILFLGENNRPSSFKTDYSISFDPHSKTNYRLPLWQFYLILNPKLKEKLFGPRINHSFFDRFCSFIVSNPGNFARNGMYQQMSSIKKVHSYGRYMTNDLSLQQANNGRYWRNVKTEFFEKYKHKYAIAFENNSYPYYTTEKLMDAFLAGSMPIYWGDPKVKQDWNVDAFINANKGTNTAFDIMKKMENDNIFFEEVYQQPIFTDEQKQKHETNIEFFETWLIKTIKK